MLSSPLSSTLTTPPKTKADQEQPVGEELLEEEQEEGEEEQEEDEQEEEEGEETDDEEESAKTNRPEPLDPQPQPQLLPPSNPDQPPAPQRNPQRNRKVFPKKTVGTTILPVTRVTRAAKQDKDIKIVSKEAVFLISIATEFFVKKLTNSAFERARRERRVFVKYNDVASAVKINTEYDWLEEVIPTTTALGTLLADPTIPSSSTAMGNRLPTDALTKSNDLSLPKVPQSKALLVGNSNSDSLEPDLSLPHPDIPPVADDGMDVDDHDELDDES